MRFWIVVFISALVALFCARYRDLDFFPTAVICLAAAFAAMLVQMAFFSGGRIANGQSPFSDSGERET